MEKKSNSIIFKTSIILLLMTFIQLIGEAQSKRSVACKLARDLKQGTLVVVLKTDHKKISWLKKFSSTGSCNEKLKYSKMLNNTISFRDTSWKYITLGFGELYQFSDVAFLMDTSIGQFLKDSSQCKYYDRNMNHITQPLKGKLFVCKYGHTFEDQSTSLQHVWYVMNSRLGRLKKPFPESIQFTIFKPSLFMKIPKEFMQHHHIGRISEKHRSLQHALKLNNELVKFYTKTGDCE
jgi:hypothetical protein